MRIDRVKFVSELTRQEMTQKTLAEKSGVSRATINYIKGGKSCSDDTGHKIAQALGMDVAKLLQEDRRNERVV